MPIYVCVFKSGTLYMENCPNANYLRCDYLIMLNSKQLIVLVRNDIKFILKLFLRTEFYCVYERERERERERGE